MGKLWYIGSISSSIIGSYTAFKFSPDSRTLICGGWGGEIEIWGISFDFDTPINQTIFGNKGSLPNNFDPKLYRWEELNKKLNLGYDGLPLIL
jgi:hypothetical protein